MQKCLADSNFYVTISSQMHPSSVMATNLTKRDIVLEIYEKTGFSQKEVRETVQLTLDTIAHALAQGKNVELRNFGVFEVKVRKARIGRNPNAPESDVPIPPRAVVKFKPGKEMREAVIKLTPRS